MNSGIWTRLRSQGTHYLVGEVLGKGLAFSFLLIVALLVPVEEYGYLNLYISVVGLLAVLFGAGLPNSIVRFYFRDEDFGEVLGTATLLILTASLLLAFLGVLSRNLLSRFLTMPLFLVVLSFAGAYALAMRNAWLSSLRARQMSKLYAITQAIEPVLFIGLTMIMYALLGKVNASQVAIGYSLATLTVSVGGIYLWQASMRLAFNWSLVKTLLPFSLPLVFHAIAMTSLSTYDQVIIAQVLGPYETGIYAFAYRFGMSMMVISIAFSSAWNPTLFDMIKSGFPSKQIDDLAQQYGNLVISLGALLMVFLPLLVRIIGGESYRESVPLVAIIIYGYLWYVLYSLVLGYLLYYDRTKAIAVASATSVLCNIVLNYIFVPRYGIVAAATTTVVSYAILFGVQLLQTRTLSTDISYSRLAAKVVLLSPIPIVMATLL